MAAADERRASLTRRSPVRRSCNLLRTPIRTSKRQVLIKPGRKAYFHRSHAVDRRRARGGAGQRPGAANQAQCCQGAAKSAQRRRFDSIASRATPSTRRRARHRICSLAWAHAIDAILRNATHTQALSKQLGTLAAGVALAGVAAAPINVFAEDAVAEAPASTTKAAGPAAGRTEFQRQLAALRETKPAAAKPIVREAPAPSAPTKAAPKAATAAKAAKKEAPAVADGAPRAADVSFDKPALKSARARSSRRRPPSPSRSATPTPPRPRRRPAWLPARRPRSVTCVEIKFQSPHAPARWRGASRRRRRPGACSMRVAAYANSLVDFPHRRPRRASCGQGRLAQARAARAAAKAAAPVAAPAPAPAKGKASTKAPAAAPAKAQLPAAPAGPPRRARPRPRPRPSRRRRPPRRLLRRRPPPPRRPRARRSSACSSRRKSLEKKPSTRSPRRARRRRRPAR